MTGKIKNLYNKAKNDVKFHSDMILAGDSFKPKWYADELTKHVYTAMYMGWLIANGVTCDEMDSLD